MRSTRLLRPLGIPRNLTSTTSNAQKNPTIQRQLHKTAVCHTDGVYRDLTNMRVRTPWIEALRQQKEERNDLTRKSETLVAPARRDLTPKKMSDSFHRVVRLVSVDRYIF